MNEPENDNAKPGDKSHSLRSFDTIVTAPDVYDESKAKARMEGRNQFWGCLLAIFYLALFIGFIVMMASG